MLFQRGLTESGGRTLMVETTIPGDGVAAGLGRGQNHLGTIDFICFLAVGVR